MVKTFSMLVLVRFLIGIAHGTYFGNDRSIVIAFTPKEKMGRGQGISLVGLGLGFFLSVFFGGMITEYFQNWRLVFVFFSIPSLITSILIFKYIKEPPRRPSGLMFKETLIISRKIFIDRNLWLMYLLGFIILFGYWMIATWMPSIYREIGIESITQSSLLSGILGLIGVPGLIISGLLSDQIAQKGYGRKGYIFLIIFLLTLLMLGIGYAVENRASSLLIGSLFFCAAFVVFGSWPPYYALLSEMVTQEISGTTFGMANLIGVLSACVAPSVSGWIKDVTGSFSGGIYLSGILLAIGMFLILFVRTSSYEENA